MTDKINIEEIFAQNVFTLDTMRKWVSEEAYNELINIMENGG